MTAITLDFNYVLVIRILAMVTAILLILRNRTSTNIVGTGIIVICHKISLPWLLKILPFVAMLSIINKRSKIDKAKVVNKV
jgi:hypothetical protein